MATNVLEPTDVPMYSTVLKNPELGHLATPTCTVTSEKDEAHPMRAVEFHGKMDMKVKFRPRPMLTDPQDVVIRVTTSCICGSDLHMYMGAMPGMKSGDVVGHEFMGIVEAVGPEVQGRRVGDRVLVSFDIACGQCSACHLKNFSGCDSTNPSLEMNALYNDRTCGMFGYSHLTGGWEGGQAEYVRVPFANVNTLKVPEELDDEHAILLTDILPTAWHANELGGVGKGDNVAIWGCGPVGILAAHCAFFRGAARVVIIDEQKFRLDFATAKVPGLETINFREKNTTKELRTLFPHGPDVAIEAVGVHYVENPLHKLEVMIGMETDSAEVINECIYGVRKGGRIGVVGAYAGYANHFNLGAFMEKGLSMAAGQTPVQKYWPTLLPLVQSGKLDPTIVITHILGLGEAPEAYKHFNAKDEGWIKVLLKPQSDPEVITEAGPGLKERARNVVSGAVLGTIDTVQKAVSVMSTDVNKWLEITGFHHDEYLQADRRFDALDEHNRLALEDSYHQVMRWNFIEDAGALCPRVCYTLPGSIRYVHISLQHRYEADISGHVVLYCVVHEIPENSTRVLRQEQRHISALFPDPALFCARSLDQSQVHISGGSVDFLLVSGGGRYNTSVGAVAKVEERRQPYRELRLLPWGISWILSPQLGLSILHG